jgi:uncharacterized membrane protein YfcA
MIELSLELALLLVGVGTLAGFIDAVAGGGGLITMPTLLFTGLNPAQAVATNKLQSSFGTLSALRFFIKKGLIHPKQHLPEVSAVLLGAALGAIAVQAIKASFLSQIMPWILIAVALYFLLTPNLGETKSRIIISASSFLVVACLIGFYDGFFGPGTGTFFALGLVVLQGVNIKEATARAKLFNFTSNIVSLTVFIAGGEVVWLYGLLMALGQFTGARLGAGMVLNKGIAIIRPLTIMMCIAMSITLII